MQFRYHVCWTRIKRDFENTARPSNFWNLYIIKVSVNSIYFIKYSKTSLNLSKKYGNECWNRVFATISHRPTSTFSFPHFFNVLAEKEILRSRATLYYAHSSTLIPVSLQRVFDLFCHTIISSLCLGVWLFYTNTESVPWYWLNV